MEKHCDCHWLLDIYITYHLCHSGSRSKVTGGTELRIDMINQLKEAVELLQDPSRWEAACSLIEVQLEWRIIRNMSVTVVNTTPKLCSIPYFADCKYVCFCIVVLTWTDIHEETYDHSDSDFFLI